MSAELGDPDELGMSGFSASEVLSERGFGIRGSAPGSSGGGGGGYGVWGMAGTAASAAVVARVAVSAASHSGSSSSGGSSSGGGGGGGSGRGSSRGSKQEAAPFSGTASRRSTQSQHSGAEAADGAAAGAGAAPGGGSGGGGSRGAGSERQPSAPVSRAASTASHHSYAAASEAAGHSGSEPERLLLPESFSGASSLGAGLEGLSVAAGGDGGDGNSGSGAGDGGYGMIEAGMDSVEPGDGVWAEEVHAGEEEASAYDEPLEVSGLVEEVGGGAEAGSVAAADSNDLEGVAPLQPSAADDDSGSGSVF